MTNDGIVRGEVAVVGAGPAGLFAAERLAAAGCRVRVFERMPSPARKLLLAGRGGLNLTHSEPPDRFIARYDGDAPKLENLVRAYGPMDLRGWASGLGVETFVGSSGRVFPVGLKASTLVRAWLRRLDGLGVTLAVRQRWIGFGDSARALRFVGPTGEETQVTAEAVVLALGGASWPRTGSDGAWVPVLGGCGVDLAPLRPANAGYAVAWPDAFAQRFAGAPVKPVALTYGDKRVRGEFVITARGVEGGAFYALGAGPRDAVAERGGATVFLDLKPEQVAGDLLARLKRPRGRLSLGPFIRRALGLSDVAYALLVALTPRSLMDDLPALAAAVKALPLPLSGLSPIERAISTAGGVRFDSGVNGRLMLRALPGVFAAGEMLDWEAPTGGYLLQGCFATAARAADGVIDYLRAQPGVAV